MDTPDTQPDELRYTKAELAAVDGKMVAVASDETVDRQGEVLSVDGWKLANFKKNPVLLWSHNPLEPPIGRAEDLRVRDIDGKKRLTFRPIFHTLTELARTVKAMFESDPPILSTFSVGFMPDEREENKFLSQELLEISAVAVPSNPSAQVIQRAMSLPGVSKKTVNDIFQKGTFVHQKPFPNEHACRLRDPDDFQQDSFRRVNQESDGKPISLILGKLKGENAMTLQAFRYPKDDWSEADARAHCTGHDGKLFEPATSEDSAPDAPAATVTGEVPVQVVKRAETAGADIIHKLTNAHALIGEVLKSAPTQSDAGDKTVEGTLPPDIEAEKQRLSEKEKELSTREEAIIRRERALASNRSMVKAMNVITQKILKESKDERPRE